jgi:hypothetical protein
MRNEINLHSFLPEEFGLSIQGGSHIDVEGRDIENHPHLLDVEASIVRSIEENGAATVNLTQREGFEFVTGLGKAKLMTLVLGQRNSEGQNYRVFATTTPDTDYARALRFAFLGKFVSQTNLWIPDQLNPLKLPWDHLTESQRRIVMDQVTTYLSGSNQLSTVGDHNQGSSISAVDPRHLLNAMAEFNAGSVANRLIEDTDPSSRPHVGDVWETKRDMMRIISANDQSDPRNDLVWDPVTFTPIFTDKAPFVALFTPNLLDEQALLNRKIVPLSANKPGALESLQEMGFATIIGKNGLTPLSQRIEMKIV